MIGLTIPLLFGLSWFVYRTRTGKAMRATAQDRDAAALMGIDVNRTISHRVPAWRRPRRRRRHDRALLQQQRPLPDGFPYGLFAFTAAVLGGIGNLNGAVLGGFIIGLVWR